MAKYLPKTSLGTLSALLMLASLVLFMFAVSLRVWVYEGVVAGGGLFEDIYLRPALVVLLLLSFLSSVGSMLIIIFAILSFEERSLSAKIALGVSSISSLLLLITLTLPF
jgi:hypothetical protein